MGIIGWIGLGFQIVKLIWQAIQFIKMLKKADPAFKVKDAVAEVNQGIDEYKKTNSSKSLEDTVHRLKKKCDGMFCGSDTKGLG